MSEPAALPRVTNILDLLDLEALDDDLFRSRINDANIRGTLYGGQVVSQALSAACRTIEGRPPHSVHGYFLRTGDASRPVLYHVERTRDGGSFSTRRVSAVQHQKPIFHLECSFHQANEGFEFATGPRHPAPPPEGLRTMLQLFESEPERMDGPVGRRMISSQVMDIRPTDPERLFTRSDDARAAFWIRLPTAAGATPDLHACALLYASDSWLAPVTRIPHAPLVRAEGFQIASLDHAMWFHAPVRADEWHLYEIESPWSGSGRSLARGTMYDRDGRIVASTTQEAMLRRAHT